MMKWLKLIRSQEAPDRAARAARAEEALHDSEEQVVHAALAAGEAEALAASLKQMRETNHFSQRMWLGIQEGLR